VDPEREEERERGGKPHEKKSVFNHFNNYCEHGYEVCTTVYHSNKAVLV